MILRKRNSWTETEIKYKFLWNKLRTRISMVAFPECSQYSAQNQKERWNTKIYTFFRIWLKEQRFRFIRNWGCFLQKGVFSWRKQETSCWCLKLRKKIMSKLLNKKERKDQCGKRYYTIQGNTSVTDEDKKIQRNQYQWMEAVKQATANNLWLSTEC